ncbi:MAG: hypothetical protein ABIT20_06850 [Gemmatimonadaceae bacterium]
MNSRLVGRFAESLLLCLALACGGASDDSSLLRGRGLKPVALSPAAEAAIYQAAVRASFDPDPSLVLLVHKRKLSLAAGYDGGDTVPPALVSALRDRGVVSGACDPRREAAKTPRCTGSRTGYVIRASPVVQAGGDTVQINFAAEVFGPEAGPGPESLRFEKIYQLVGSGTTWRVAREARVRQPK